MSAEKLYTPALLALTMELGSYPFDETLPLTGQARSKSCGSTLIIALERDGKGQIDRFGMRVQACAVGQASAAIFARHAAGRSADDVTRALASIESWLSDSGELPDWPDIGMLTAARAYPGRHGAILLPWKAALDALSTPASGR